MNKKRILILLLLTFLLTGCVKYDLDMKVGSDKSFTLTIIDAMEKEYAESLNTSTDTSNYEKLGYEVEEYSDSTHVGVKLTKKFASIDDISSDDCPTIELTNLIQEDISSLKLFKSKKIGTTTTYVANFTYDLSMEDMETTESTEEIDYTEYTDTMIFTYTIALPDNALVVSENADEKSNNNHTLTWNMKYGELKEINFSFNIDDNDVTAPIIDDDNNNDKNIIEDNEEEVEEQESTSEKEIYTTDSGKNVFGTIIGSLLVVVLVLGTIVHKIKNKKESVKPTIAMTHKAPPKNRKE